VKIIVDNIISHDGILPNCTKIVATHNKTLLSAADHVIVLRGGLVAASGDLSSDKVLGSQ
jgi:ABC-type bacteriocin/lantibiotic exporter with double-glycine peptidase domain